RQTAPPPSPCDTPGVWATAATWVKDYKGKTSDSGRRQREETMSDFGRVWFAPMWFAPTPTPVPPRPPVVWIFNPGSKAASVAVVFQSTSNYVISELKDLIGAKDTKWFVGPSENGGSVRVASDQPIAVWGQTYSFGPTELGNWVTMTFYRQ